MEAQMNWFMQIFVAFPIKYYAAVVDDYVERQSDPWSKRIPILITAGLVLGFLFFGIWGLIVTFYIIPFIGLVAHLSLYLRLISQSRLRQ